ncbi:hillarin-like isoform X1 [Haliotis cracherodii]|uniref:hillarin-like isoform X1 n=1 Tax=Haliotis cracherodii TaxID=6455 RepID=UPI0039E8C215
MDDPQSSDGDSDGEHPRQPQDPCYRCEKRVYPVERVDVGVLFHRRCFRCRVCGLQLTLRTFHWDQENQPDVYCNAHVPKHVAKIDKDSVGIKSALNAPKRGTNTSDQTRGSVYNPGWQYDANALEFAHYREIFLRGKQKTSTGTYSDYEKCGVFDAQLELEGEQKKEEDELYATLKMERQKKVKRLEEELKVEKDNSVRDLVSTLERFSPQKGKSGLAKETERLEEHYKLKREEKMKRLIEKMSVEERQHVARLIQKHSQEMLLMIAERLSTVDDRSSPDSEDRSPTIDLSRPPPVSPPEFKKAQLFKSPTIFEKLDNHVLDVAKEGYTTFTNLVKDLIVECETDLEKTRAIFRWVTWTDLNTLDMEESVKPDSPLSLLRGIKYGTETYHDLFKRLCSYAGLHCEVIQGYSKGAGYRPGMKIEGDRFRNTWTAVCINGSWCFINCNWGARHVKGAGQGQTKGQGPLKPQVRIRDKRDDLSLFSYKCDEFYFVTDPEDHIYQHFPDDPEWQLLECPITLSEFINLPVVKSPFFNYGLKFTMHYDCKQQTEHGVALIQLKIPSLVGFGYTLDPKDRRIDPSALEGRVMLRIIGHKAIFTVAPPKSGRYYFTIYAKDDWVSDSLQSACAFQIKCRERKESIRSPYPKVSFFGPTPSMSSYGLSPQTHIDPVVTCSHEDLAFQFHLHQDVRLSHSLHYHGNEADKSNEDLQRYVFIKQRDDDSISYLVRCPMVGKYVFAVFGAKMGSPDSENNVPYECLFRYLIECRQGAKDKRPFPRACHRWHSCTLLEPFVGDLEIEKRVTFRVRAPLASDVALLTGDAWFHFKLLADAIWEGTVVTGKHRCIAKLYAKLNREKARFSPLVEFQIK